MWKKIWFIFYSLCLGIFLSNLLKISNILASMSFQSLNNMEFWIEFAATLIFFHPGRLFRPGRLLAFHKFSIQDAYSAQDVY